MTKKIAVVGSMINSSEYLLFENLETGYSLERYDSVEEARNSDCDAVIVTDKDKIDNEETSILYYNKPVVEGFDMISFDSPKTKCRIKDDRCVRKQIAKRRKETRILKHIEKDEYILRNQLCNILYTYYPCIDHIHIWLKKG